MIRFLPAFIVVAVIGGCSNTEKVAISELLPIDSIIEQQARNLAQSNLMLEKTTLVNGKPSSITITPYPSEWIKELDVLKEFKIINEPALRGFLKESIAPDPKSNLMIKAWMPQADVHLKELRIYYHEELNRLKRVKARIESRGFLFSTDRNLSMEFDIMHEVLQLSEYKINVSQKYFWNSTDSISVHASIRPQ